MLPDNAFNAVATGNAATFALFSLTDARPATPKSESTSPGVIGAATSKTSADSGPTATMRPSSNFASSTAPRPAFMGDLDSHVTALSESVSTSGSAGTKIGALYESRVSVPPIAAISPFATVTMPCADLGDRRFGKTLHLEATGSNLSVLRTPSRPFSPPDTTIAPSAATAAACR